MLKQSTAVTIILKLYLSSDHVSPATSKTLSVSVSKAGGAFASISPTVTERTSGWYAIALTSSHTDTLGDLVIRVTASDCDDAERLVQVVGFDPGQSIGAAVWGYVTETGWTAVEAVRVMLAALAGKVSGASGTAIAIRDVNDSTDRITATVDVSGNRTAVSYDKA